MSNPNVKHTPVRVDMDLMRRTDEIHLVRECNGHPELVAKICGDYSFALKAAAAPELLEALEALGNACMNEWGLRFNESSVGKRALAAITKATGSIK